jgi:hypothetical protein
VFASRERELGQLDERLGRALAGRLVAGTRSFPFLSLGTVVKNGEGWQWQPIATTEWILPVGPAQAGCRLWLPRRALQDGATGRECSFEHCFFVMREEVQDDCANLSHGYAGH